MASKSASKPIKLPELEIEHLELELVSLSSLIMHRWSEKVKKEMLAKHTKQAKASGKEAKDPQRDYEESIYYMEDGRYGFPSTAFKSAFVRAGTYIDDSKIGKMTYLRGAFHVDGELVPVYGEPKMREDMVRVGMGQPDIRFRAEFPDWRAVVPVSLNVRALSVEQLLNLANIAGFAVGIGEWRPEKEGQYGRFRVGTVQAVEDPQ